MTLSTLDGVHVEEGATPVYTAQIKDDADTNLPKASMSSLTLRAVNSDTGAIVLADTSIFADVDANGLLTTVLPASIFEFQDTDKLPDRIERRKLIFTLSYSGRVDIHHLNVRIRRSTNTGS